LPRWLGKLAYPDFPEVARSRTARQCVNYNAAIEFMKQPPARVSIRVFQPLRPLPVGTFTIEQKRLDAASDLGDDEALQQIALVVP